MSNVENYLSARQAVGRVWEGEKMLTYRMMNIEEALKIGECIDEAEKVMGVTEVKNTINRIKYIYINEKDIKAALDSRLPEPCKR